MRDSERRIVLLTGTCGAGKSTVADLLAAKGWARVSEDEIWPQLFGKQRGAFGSDEHRAKRAAVHAIVFHAVMQAVSAGRNVVIDATVHESPPEAFTEYREFFAARGLAWELKVLHPSLEVAVARDAARTQGSLGRDRVASLYDKFTRAVFPARCFLDTSTQTPEQTLAALEG